MLKLLLMRCDLNDQRVSYHACLLASASVHSRFFLDSVHQRGFDLVRIHQQAFLIYPTDSLGQLVGESISRGNL